MMVCYLICQAQQKAIRVNRVMEAIKILTNFSKTISKKKMLMKWTKYQELTIQFLTMEKIMQACKIFVKMILIKKKKTKWYFKSRRNSTKCRILLHLFSRKEQTEVLKVR